MQPVRSRVDWEGVARLAGGEVGPLFYDASRDGGGARSGRPTGWHAAGGGVPSRPSRVSLWRCHTPRVSPASASPP